MVHYIETYPGEKLDSIFRVRDKPTLNKVAHRHKFARFRLQSTHLNELLYVVNIHYLEVLMVDIIEPHFWDGLVQRRLPSLESSRCATALLMTTPTELTAAGARATSPSSPLQKKLIFIKQKNSTILRTTHSHLFFSPREIFQIVKG